MLWPQLYIIRSAVYAFLLSLDNGFSQHSVSSQCLIEPESVISMELLHNKSYIKTEGLTFERDVTAYPSMHCPHKNPSLYVMHGPLLSDAAQVEMSVILQYPVGQGNIRVLSGSFPMMLDMFVVA